MTNNKIIQGHSIYIYDDELQFIRNLLEVKGISLECLDLNQNILNLNGKYVGFIKTSRRVIEIIPKHEDVNLNHILRMYFFVYGSFNNFNDDIFDLSSNTLSLDIMSQFIKELEIICRKGLPTEYVTLEENSKYASGSINYVKTYTNIRLLKEEPFCCSRDELSLQTPLNFILKAALNKVINYVEQKESLSYITRVFSGINDSFSNELLKKVIINNKNFYCRNALFYAKLILEESYYDSIGGYGGESFLIDGDLLFELFTKKVLFTITNDKYFIDWNYDKEYGIYGDITKSFVPDILYNYSEIDERSQGILDVKNKFSTIFKNADVFQMLFYSGMLKSKKLILCYPSTYDRTPETLEINSENFVTKKIYAVFINICNESQQGFVQSLNKFIEDIYFVLTK